MDTYTKCITFASIVEVIGSMFLTVALLITNSYLFNDSIIVLCIWYGFIGLNCVFSMTLICGLMVAIMSYFEGYALAQRYFTLSEPSR